MAGANDCAYPYSGLWQSFHQFPGTGHSAFWEPPAAVWCSSSELEDPAATFPTPRTLALAVFVCERVFWIRVRLVCLIFWSWPCETGVFRGRATRFLISYARGAGNVRRRVFVKIVAWFGPLSASVRSRNATTLGGRGRRECGSLLRGLPAYSLLRLWLIQGAICVARANGLAFPYSGLGQPFTGAPAAV